MAMYHGYVSWPCIMAMYHGYVSWLRIMAMYRSYVSWFCIMAMYHMLQTRWETYMGNDSCESKDINF